MSRKLTREVKQRMLEEQLLRCENPELSEVVQRNIGVIELRRRRQIESRSLQDRVADWITNFSGSMAFFYLHVVWFGFWIVMNVDMIPGLKAFDPFPFGLLTMIVSLEAIFLSTFVLISQNRMAHLADQSEALDLQINLLAEYEITRTLRLVDRIAQKLGIEEAADPDLAALEKKVEPEALMEEIEHKTRENGEDG